MKKVSVSILTLLTLLTLLVIVAVVVFFVMPKEYQYRSAWHPLVWFTLPQKMKIIKYQDSCKGTLFSKGFISCQGGVCGRRFTVHLNALTQPDEMDLMIKSGANLVLVGAESQKNYSARECSLFHIDFFYEEY